MEETEETERWEGGGGGAAEDGGRKVVLCHDF